MGSYRKAGSPGKPRFGQSLTLPTRGCLAHDVMPYKLVDQLTKISYGVTSQGRITRKAPVRTEPHPTNPRCLEITPTKEYTRAHIARQDHAESPVRTEPHPTCARSQLMISSLAPRAAFQLPANRRAHNRRCGLGPHTVRRPVQRFVHG